MDFTPLFTEIMKAGPWALVCLLLVGFLWKIAAALMAWFSDWVQPMVGSVVDAHLSYLKSVSESQGQIHSALENQTQALHQNNQILDRLDKRLNEHQEEKMRILSAHTEMLRRITDGKNHKPLAGE